MELTPLIIGEFLSVMMFLSIIALLMLGYPVAFSLGGIALIFGFIGHQFGAFDYALLRGLPSRFFGIMSNEVLVAVPLFVFMGVMLERSKIAEQLLETMGQLFGRIRGGLGISVVLVGTMLAASTGIVGATVVTMGLLSLPAMLRAGYDPKLATGIICASGTLGQIIPPSTVLIFLGDILQGANTTAQIARGNFAPEPVSVGDLFAGAFIPGLLLSSLYIGWVLTKAVIQPASCPPLAMDADQRRNLGRRVVIALIPPLFLIIAVLGSILAGVATPTESASVGSVGAILLTVVKMVSERMTRERAAEAVEQALFWFWTGFMALLVIVGFAMGGIGGSAYFAANYATFLLLFLSAVLVGATTVVLAMADLRAVFVTVLQEVMRSTMTISSMVFIILFGASIFSLIFRGLGGDHLVEEFLAAMPGGRDGALIVVMLIMFVLGFFLDTFEIIFIIVPIAGPILLKMDVDPVWLGVAIGVNLQTSFLTPPFGFSLFYLRGVAPRSVTTGHIYRGIVPFVAIQVLVIVILWEFPRLATWLPDVIYRGEVIEAPPPPAEPLQNDDAYGQGGDAYGEGNQ